jgi:hypothetical protein
MESPTRRRFDRLRPTSGSGVLMLGALLVVLLGLVAAASRVHRTPGSQAGVRQPSSGVGDYVFSILAVVVVSGSLFLLYLWLSEHDLLAEQRRRSQGKGAYKAIGLVIAFGLIAAVVAQFHFGFGGLRALGHRATPNRAKLLKQLSHTKGQPRPPDFQWLPVFVAAAGGMALLGFIGVRSIRRGRDQLMERFVLDREFEKLIDDTLDDLRAEKDPRRAIIAAYARMERLFATSGVPRAPAEAPMEYLGRALLELRASGAALGRLTGLFQWAKFSAHDVDEPMREEAIAALTQVRDELRANRREDEQRRAEAAALRDATATTGDDEDRTFGENPFDAAHEKMKGNIYTQR